MMVRFNSVILLLSRLQCSESCSIAYNRPCLVSRLHVIHTCLLLTRTAPIPIAPIVAAVVVIAGIATVGGLCYRRRWYTRVNKQWMKAGVNKLLRRKLALSEKADIGGGATNGDSPTAAASPATLLAVAAFASGSKRRLMVGTDGLGTGSGSPSRSPSRTLVRASGRYEENILHL